MVILALDMTIIVPIAVFGLFAAGAWLLIDLMSKKKPRAEERLDEFRDPRLRQRQQAEEAGKAAAMTKVLEKATPALAKPLQPKSEKDQNKLKLKLAQAGFRAESAPTAFLGLKIASMIFGVVLSGGSVLALASYDQLSILKAVVRSPLKYVAAPAMDAFDREKS